MRHEQSSGQAKNAWRVLILLFLVNLLNYFDRTIPGVVLEPIRKEFSLNDLQLGILNAAFVFIYAIAGIPLGRLADTQPRRYILSLGLAVWSALTAATGLAWNFISLVLIRMGVGVGEASCAPAATSMIGDLFPTEKRARAMGVFMIGLPLGLILAFVSVGLMMKAFKDWRVPFFIAAVPGMILSFFVLFIREPRRGAAEKNAGGATGANSASSGATDASTAPANPVRKILKIKTVWWLILTGVTLNFASYGGNAFMVPLLQRYFGLPIASAAVITGCIVGLTGLIGLTAGGYIADKIHQRSETGRLRFGALMLFVSAAATFIALRQDRTALMVFAVLFGFGWLTYYSYFTTVYPALHDVVEPRLRATAMAVYFAGTYLLGGAAGTVVMGALSDAFAKRAMEAAGATELTEAFRAVGLHGAMYLVPVTIFMTAVLVVAASITFKKDHAAMLSRMDQQSR